MRPPRRRRRVAIVDEPGCDPHRSLSFGVADGGLASQLGPSRRSRGCRASSGPAALALAQRAPVSGAQLQRHGPAPAGPGWCNEPSATGWRDEVGGCPLQPRLLHPARSDQARTATLPALDTRSALLGSFTCGVSPSGLRSTSSHVPPPGSEVALYGVLEIGDLRSLWPVAAGDRVLDRGGARCRAPVGNGSCRSPAPPLSESCALTPGAEVVVAVEAVVAPPSPFTASLALPPSRSSAPSRPLSGVRSARAPQLRPGRPVPPLRLSAARMARPRRRCRTSAATEDVLGGDGRPRLNVRSPPASPMLIFEMKSLAEGSSLVTFSGRWGAGLEVEVEDVEAG